MPSDSVHRHVLPAFAALIVVGAFTATLAAWRPEIERAWTPRPVPSRAIPDYQPPPEDRNALEHNLGNDFPSILLGSDVTAEHAFECCLMNRRLARLYDSMASEPAPQSAAVRVFDQQFYRLQQDTRALVESWESARHPREPVPLNADGVGAALFLCMEFCPLDEVLSCIDRWNGLAEEIDRHVAAIDYSDIQFADEHVKRVSRSQRMVSLIHYLRAKSRPEPLFLVNVYLRLLEMRCGEGDIAAVTAASPLRHLSVQTMTLVDSDRDTRTDNVSSARHMYRVRRSWGGWDHVRIKSKVLAMLRLKLESCTAEPAKDPTEK